MGFTEDRSKKALKKFRNNIDSAMDFLLNAPPDQDIIDDEDESGSNRQNNEINEEALKTLMEMGYGREDAIYALRITNNNVEHACTYLLSNPNPSASSRGASSFFRFGTGGRSGAAATS